jgi:tetratricopeptide (TPR) repeat protein
VIPRWRDSRIALTTGELEPGISIQKGDAEKISLIKKRLQLWNQTKSIEIAAELVSCCVSFGLYSFGEEAAEFIVKEYSSTSKTVLEMAENLLICLGKSNGNDEKVKNPEILTEPLIYHRIHFLKKLIIDYPLNSLSWVDLSLAYILLGQLDQSKRAMNNALSLSPNNRFVLRSATRLFVHLDDPEYAHSLLFLNELTRKDPWLIAAEIATAAVANLTPKFVRLGQRLLENKEFSNFHLAELASSLATLELSSGSNKKARKLFQQSLLKPTDNSVAQSVWVKREFSSLDTDNAIRITPRTYEAQAIKALLNQNWIEAITFSKLWLSDESFSSRPAEFGSYAASLGLEDYEMAEDFTRRGLIANPYDLTLINNLAFAQANQGKLAEARKTLFSYSWQNASDKERIALTATHGMINLREGNIGKGKDLYNEAIYTAKISGRLEHKALASLYFAREMYFAGEFSKDVALSFANDATRTIVNPGVSTLMNNLKNIITHNS